MKSVIFRGKQTCLAMSVGDLEQMRKAWNKVERISDEKFRHI